MEAPPGLRLGIGASSTFFYLNALTKIQTRDLSLTFSISIPSTSRSTSTSSESGLHVVMFASFMCPPHHSTPTSSPRGFLRWSSVSSGSVWTFAVLPIRLRVRVRRLYIPSMGCCVGLAYGPRVPGAPALLVAATDPRRLGLIARLGKAPLYWLCFYKPLGSLPIYVYLHCTLYQSIYNSWTYSLSETNIPVSIFKYCTQNRKCN